LRRPGEAREPVVGDDTFPTHLAACQGVASTINLAPNADWLWGTQPSGPSPWYPALQIVRA
jgi:ADP-heptose:LPS heptosyltransferase